MGAVIRYCKTKLNDIGSGDSEIASKLIEVDTGLIMKWSACYINIKPGYIIFFSVAQFLVYCYLLVHHMSCLFVTAYYSYMDGDVDVAMQSIFYFVLLSFCLFELIWLNYRRHDISALSESLADGFTYDNLEGLSLDSILENSETTRKRIYQGVFLYLLFCGFIILLVVPLVSINGGTLPKLVSNCNHYLPVAMWTPFYSSSGFGLLVAFILQVCGGLIVIAVMGFQIIFDLTLNQRILEHLKVLNYCLANIQTRSVNLFKKKFPNLWTGAVTDGDRMLLYQGDEFQECFLRSLIVTAKHHQYILNSVSLLQVIASLGVHIIVMSGPLLIALTACGMLSESVSIENKISGVTLCLVLIVGIGILCWYGEEIKTWSDEIRLQLYFCPWAERTTKVKKVIGLIQTCTTKSLKPIHSYVDVEVNYATFRTIINTSYSFINIFYAVRSST